MSSISWAPLETFSAAGFSTSTASSGDDWWRSFLTSVATGLSPSFIWPGSGGGSAASAGISQFGNARAAQSPNSAVTGGHGNGFLLLNTTSGSLHHIGSAWTGMLGHPLMIDHGSSGVSAPFRARWLTQVGSFSLDSTVNGDSGSTTVRFPTPYSILPPFVMLSTDGNNANTAYQVSFSTITAGGFTSRFSGLKSGESTCNVWWESDGTVAT